uniref:Uncharacterized protein n=1 Tax=Tetraselmis chuii TaxID=63592 RepID=A0A7S1X340_9CHLO|mmetsp:Transcript_23810/g.42354  ORF Transcript_23810/g.42354 Transcript_23810/m.42354 type:complete len:179 (+) Transcript_23810:544-1080(+)|eukprot:CAMPEP_0177788682 /NCGR_PEP_ID=MMETSP0491_2-20121128/22276_1 /TAXON_ID=63592 /ORGANISM="Tetraselmis chuii, Strain PLY429" /LENGTH=178 /DNA_ID=CAMNT_0019310355 /DNA_START=481 /DNA_END=1014 /DNA_ORIENTATION=-
MGADVSFVSLSLSELWFLWAFGVPVIRSRLEARVARCRHHGRNLVFVSLCDGGGLVRQVVFDSQHFGGCTCRSPRCEKFPSNKASIRVGDELALLVREVDGRQVVRAWQRLSCQRGEGAARTAVAPSGRRSGVAAESGWVGCPLCPPSSPKRYNRRGGLKTHLEAIHTGGVEVLGKDG